MGFKEDIAAAIAGTRRSITVPIELNGHKYKFKFTQMDGTEYAAETLRHPPRLEIGLDREFGYNLNSLSQAVAPKCGVRLDGAEEIEMSAEEWADLFAAADGGAVQEIANTIFTLNQFASAKAVQAVKKVLDGSLPN